MSDNNTVSATVDNELPNQLPRKQAKLKHAAKHNNKINNKILDSVAADSDIAQQVQAVYIDSDNNSNNNNNNNNNTNNNSHNNDNTATNANKKRSLAKKDNKEPLHTTPVSKRKYSDYVERVDNTSIRIKRGMVDNMNVDCTVYCNDILLNSLYDEMNDAGYGPNPEVDKKGGFLPALIQVANVSSLPGIVGHSLAMPDIHSGYGFSIGGVAAFDINDNNAVVSPGGVGFDINCGVRLIRSNINKDDISQATLRDLADTLYNNIPVGVGRQSHETNGGFKVTSKNLDYILQHGMKYAETEGICWPEDRSHVEAHGCLPNADPSCVSDRAKRRGLPQVGSLGSGNHYIEVQYIESIMPGAEHEADVMGLKQGNIVIMLHSGSRGLGHQVCTDYLQTIEQASRQQNLKFNDRQLAAVRISSNEGQSYLKAMNAAANFAFVNRTIMANHIRNSFEHVFKKTPRELDMHIVYDVCHNIAKIEQHSINGRTKQVLVHRKGATRSFPPYHNELPDDYKTIGQPVLIGGSMGTESWVLVGTEGAMKLTFGSTCHGAGRALSRAQSMKQYTQKDVETELAKNNIIIKIANKKMIAEEAPHAYKDVGAVVETCEKAGFSKRVVRLKPLAVIKG